MLEQASNLLVGAATIALLVHYRDRGVLRWIGQSKVRFRRWLTDARN